MPTLFISYKRGTTAVAPLMEKLKEAGYELWFDREDIHLGDSSWKASIVRGLERCDGVILCISPAACESEPVRYEVSKALEQGKKIFPIILEKVASSSTALKELGLPSEQPIEDFTDVTRWQEQCDRLLRDLKTHGLQATPKKPSQPQSYDLTVCMVHADADKAKAQELSDRLKADGFTISSAEGNVSWQQLLEAEISQSDVVVLCFSRSALKDEIYIKSKLVFALEFARRLGTDSCMLISVALDPCLPPSHFQLGLSVHLYTPRLQYSMLLSRLQARAASLTQQRMLDVALPGQAQKERAIELLVLARLPDSEGLRKLLGATQEYAVKPEDVASKGFDLAFPRNEQGTLSPVELWVKLETTDFIMPIDRKRLVVLPESDSAPLIFLLTPKRTGTLKLLVQVNLPDDTPVLSMLLQVESHSVVAEETLKAAMRVMSIAMGTIGLRKPPDKRYLPVGVTLALSQVVMSNNPEWLLPVSENKAPPTRQPSEIDKNAGLPRELLDLHTSHQRRLEIGEQLDRRGDTRRGVGLQKDGLPDILWLPVAPGGKLEIAGETFKVEPFYIAKYQVTCDQYEAFVKAGDGYRYPAWWWGMPSEYQRQELREQNQKGLNNPRESVSWYESVAFGRWLNHRLRGMKLPNPGNALGKDLVVGENAQVRLPTEWEWQWAAQGGEERREYPWGKWREGYANTDEAKLNRTVAVGMYPQGAAACGALDMSGNVWEWCLNKYRKPEEVAVDESRESRVQRGGSCSDDEAIASCAYRSLDYPLRGNTSVGFRLVVCSANAPL